LVKAICCVTIDAFSVVYRSITALRFLLVLVLINIFSVLNVYMSTTECPTSVFMALANKKLVDPNEKQNLELSTSKNRKNY